VRHLAELFLRQIIHALVGIFRPTDKLQACVENGGQGVQEVGRLAAVELSAPGVGFSAMRSAPRESVRFCGRTFQAHETLVGEKFARGRIAQSQSHPIGPRVCVSN
jgi:hypothetical protein